MKIAVRSCRVAEIFDDAAGRLLLAAYAQECGLRVIGQPAPNRSRYEALEAAGLAQCFAAYVDGALVGFANVLITIVPHYEVSCATVESLFVLHEARRGGAGAQLMDAVNEYARGAGCASIFYTAQVGSKLARLLFLCDDQYAHTHYVFSKRLA